MRGDGGVAGEGRVVGVSKFHSWAKCTMPSTNIKSDCMSNASSGLRIIFIYLRVSSSNILGCNKTFHQEIMHVDSLVPSLGTRLVHRDLGGGPMH